MARTSTMSNLRMADRLSESEVMVKPSPPLGWTERREVEVSRIGPKITAHDDVPGTCEVFQNGLSGLAVRFDNGQLGPVPIYREVRQRHWFPQLDVHREQIDPVHLVFLQDPIERPNPYLPGHGGLCEQVSELIAGRRVRQVLGIQMQR